MKILKNIFISLGVIFVLFIGIYVYLIIDSGKFKEEHEPYISSFMQDFSSNWDIKDVYSRLTNDLIQQIETPAGHNALNIFKRLGGYEGMSDLSMDNYNSGTSGITAVLTFKASFSTGPALVRITLLKSNNKTLVQGINITTTNDTPSSNIKHEA